LHRRDLLPQRLQRLPDLQRDRHLRQHQSWQRITYQLWHHCSERRLWLQRNLRREWQVRAKRNLQRELHHVQGCEHPVQ
jgi:hypothetical protein